MSVDSILQAISFPEGVDPKHPFANTFRMYWESVISLNRNAFEEKAKTMNFPSIDEAVSCLRLWWFDEIRKDPYETLH